jgi:hypothetical protein
MQTAFFFAASMAILGVFATPAPSPVGVEVVYRDGQTYVREVVSFSSLTDLLSS